MAKANKQWGTNAEQETDAAPHCHIPMASQLHARSNRKEEEEQKQKAPRSHAPSFS
jgi:hypothetical protein